MPGTAAAAAAAAGAGSRLIGKAKTETAPEQFGVVIMAELIAISSFDLCLRPGTKTAAMQVHPARL